VTGSSPPVAACTVSWGTEQLEYITAPAQTTDYQLRVGPLVSEVITVTVVNPTDTVPCNQASGGRSVPVQPRLVITPDRSRIVFGERVRLRASFGYEMCGRLLRPSFMTGLESRRGGAIYSDQPAQDVISGPTRDANGDLVYEVSPKMTTSYRLMFLGNFGEFTTIEVAPRLELELLRRTTGPRVAVRVRVHADASLVGARVDLERQTALGWERLTSLKLGGNLTAVTRVRLNARALRLRAALPATARYGASASPAVSVRGTIAPRP